MLWFTLCLHIATVTGAITPRHNGSDAMLVHGDMNTLNEVIRNLADNLKRWNDLFLNTLEPRIVSTATSLATIDSNINNLQERAHAWDTFQLHVAAWNDQLAALDRKVDIISKGQEKLMEIETKIASIEKVEYQLSEALKKIKYIEETLKRESEIQRLQKDYDYLLGEFATRGILNSVKAIEKKLDRLLIPQENLKIRQKNIEKRQKVTIKCNTPRFIEDILKDVSSKVDIIFDRLDKKDEDSDVTNSFGSKAPSISKQVYKRDIHDDAEMIRKISTIENISLTVLDTLTKQCSSYGTKFESMFNQQRQYLESLLPEIRRKCLDKDVEISDVITELNKTGCDDLDGKFKPGIYIFDANSQHSKKYCDFRDNFFWTVIQRRQNNYPQNFNQSWSNYKNGFGNLNNDFWLGNDVISQLSKEHDLVLRIELTDFSGNYVWAEYDKFKVLSEVNNYQIIIMGGYRGNASDSLSSHNGSFFSTFDRKNDLAPACCPCAVSYGGGWWFNSCFESNLNGVYHEEGVPNGYYGGIIWETWLGNYSLKKTLMMVRKTGKAKYQTTTAWPYYEDP